MRIFHVSVAVVSALALAACSHNVSIDSDPPGAKIKVNGSYIGDGPATFTETTGWEKSYEIVAEPKRGGYRTTSRIVRQTEWNTGVVAGSVGTGICFSWTGVGLLGFIGLAFSRQLPDRIVVTLEEGTADGAVTPDEPVDDYGY